VRSCHSVTLETQGLFSGTTRIGTAVKLTVRNLQGQHIADNMAWSALSAVRLYRPTVLGSTSGSSTPTLNGGATGTPSAWSWATAAAGTWGNLRFLGAAGSRIGGCVTGSGNGMWTCPGEVIFSMSTSELFDANEFNELYLTWAGSPNAGACTTDQTRSGGGVAQCDPQNTTVNTSVTPEPITIALLGTGLFGIGGAHLRRRRKNNEV
jgi:hypothetical protein